MDIFEVFSGRAWQHLITSLLHTVWQGAVIALLLSAALRRLPARRPDARYLLSLTAQLAILLAGLATWSILEYEPSRRPAPRMGSGALEMAYAGAARPIASGPVARGSFPSPRADRDSPRWVSVVAMGWLAGVAIMLGRTVGSVWSASRLVRGPRVSDPALLAMIGRVRDELGIGRPVRAVEVAEGCGPAMLGVLWPTLLWPASAMTGLPADTLRAILIHELTHVRRLDYLVNLVQMVVESVLFFNPSVWWLGRQARLEREACCDAAAVRLTGRPIDYSWSLAEWAGRSRAAGIAVAWAGDHRAGTLLERIRRVLRPGERPAARVSPSGLLLLLLGGPALLLILWRGTGAAVSLAAQILSPAERIRRVQAAQAEYGPPIVDLDGKGTLEGTITTADGRPLSGPVQLYHRTEKPGGNGIMGTLAQSRGEFSVGVPAGMTWLTVAPEDYAPAVAGPFDVRPGRTIDGIAIVLEAGSPAKIAVTDGRGAPVAGARVSAHLIIGDRGSIGASNGWTADRGGVVTILHAMERPYHFTVSARGYEPLESVALTPSFERTTILTLKPTRPARGVAVDPKGRPVAGAEVRVFREEEEHGVHEYHVSGPLLATTGADGRFTLDTLKARTRYILFVTSKAGGRGISSPVRAGQDGIRVTVGPRLTIEGAIRPRADAEGAAAMPAVVDVTQRFRVPGGGETTYNVSWRIPVGPRGHFSISDLLPCETGLEAAGRAVRVTPERPRTTVTIDLNEPVAAIPMRRVVLHVATPDGAVPPSGTVFVTVDRPGAPTASRKWPIEDGRAVLEAPVPSRLTYQLRSMVGYWFKDGFGIEIEPGEGGEGRRDPGRAGGGHRRSGARRRRPAGRGRCRDPLPDGRGGARAGG